MATRTSVALQPSNSTDPLFQAWVQFIEDTLVTTGGWVVTGDTGQMTIASAAHPTLANTKVGYRIYRMNDALQATAPVFMRLDYGSGAAANTPGVWVVIGQSTDGAGTITNVRYTGSTSTPTVAGSANSTTGTWNSYGSADSGRFAFALFVSTTATQGMTAALERSRDPDGTLNGNGLVFMCTQSSSVASCIGISRYIVLSAGAQPPVEQGIGFTLSTANPSAFGSDVGIGMPIPFKGVAQPPALSYVIVRSSDFVAEAQFAVTIYGASHNFVHLSSMQGSLGVGGNSTADSQSRACMRYE